MDPVAGSSLIYYNTQESDRAFRQWLTLCTRVLLDWIKWHHTSEGQQQALTLNVGLGMDLDLDLSLRFSLSLWMSLQLDLDLHLALLLT